MTAVDDHRLDELLGWLITEEARTFLVPTIREGCVRFGVTVSTMHVVWKALARRGDIVVSGPRTGITDIGRTRFATGWAEGEIAARFGPEFARQFVGRTPAPGYLAGGPTTLDQNGTRLRDYGPQPDA